MDLDSIYSIPLSDYSREDLKDLSNYLTSSSFNGFVESDIAIKDFRKGLKNCMYKMHDLQSYPFNTPVDFTIFSTGMLNLPLYINDPDPITVGVARWRLFIGR